MVGATSSLAQAMCHVLAREGYAMIISGRDEAELDLLARDLVVRHNVPCLMLVADFLDVNFTTEYFFDSAGDFDHLIIATGTMGSGEPLSLSNIAFTNHINYTLPAQIATLAAVKLAEKKEGSIVIISSIAGDRGRASNYAYGSAKAALTTFASGLRNYFHTYGGHVMTVKPGFIDTPMTWGMKSPLMASRGYVAEKIITAMHKKKNVIYVPFFWKYIMLAITRIPEGIFKRLKL